MKTQGSVSKEMYRYLITFRVPTGPFSLKDKVQDQALEGIDKSMLTVSSKELTIFKVQQLIVLIESDHKYKCNFLR